jgi:hypothetical protein
MRAGCDRVVDEEDIEDRGHAEPVLRDGLEPGQRSGLHARDARVVDERQRDGCHAGLG